MAKITMREAISQALMEEMDRDPAVFIMGEEVGVWGGTYAVTKGFYDKYGHGGSRIHRSLRTHYGAAIGAAMVGRRRLRIDDHQTLLFRRWITSSTSASCVLFGGQFSVPMVIRAVGGGGRQLGPRPTRRLMPSLHISPPEGRLAWDAGGCQQGLLKNSHSSNDPVLFTSTRPT